MNIKGFFYTFLFFAVSIIITGCDHQKKSKKLIPELSNQNDVIAQFWDSPLYGIEGNPHINSISSNVELFNQKKKKSTLKKLKSNDHENLHILNELEAKLSDIPVPMQAIPLFSVAEQEKKQLDSLQDFCLGYLTELNSEEIIKFYNSEMERLGWQQKIKFEQPEPLIIYEKPFKVCVISIRSNKHNTDGNSCLFLFLGNKKEQARH